MTNDAIIVATYSLLAVGIIVTMAVSWAKDVLQARTKAYFALSGCALGWLVFVILFHLVSDEDVARYIVNVPFLFIAFCPVALLIFSMRYYRFDSPISTKFILLLSIVPALTSIISLFPPMTWMLRTEFVLVQTYPVHIMEYKWNFWFYVHLVYSYGLMLAASVFVIWQHFKQARDYVFPSLLMVAAIVVTMVCNILKVADPFVPYDYTLLGTGCAVLLYYFALVNNPAVEYLTLARNDLYNHVDLPVFILNKQDQVRDMNIAAKAFLTGIQCSFSPPFTFANLLEAIEDAGGRVERGYGEEEHRDDRTSNVLLPMGGRNAVYTFTWRSVTGKKGQVLGRYIIMMDITQISEMIVELEYLSEIDPLTGIANRRTFDERCVELDAEEHLPISVIMGDVNGLKAVNDSMGHRAGDELLKLVAKVFQEECPSEGTAARIGGDEFIIVLPNCAMDKAARIKSEIEARVMHEAARFAQASIALGVATREDMQINIADLITKADEEMYRQKRYDRRAR